MAKYNNEQLSLFNMGDESDDFFNKKRDWSASKHRIMLKYIQSFCFNLQGQSQVLNYVDGFAGEGKYNSGIGIKDFVTNSDFWRKHQFFFSDTDGSPLIALKCASIFHDENRVNLRCFFPKLIKKEI